MCENEPKDEVRTVDEKVVTEQVKRGRGRPKGSKNKPKLPVESTVSQ